MRSRVAHVSELFRIQEVGPPLEHPPSPRKPFRRVVNTPHGAICVRQLHFYPIPIELSFIEYGGRQRPEPVHRGAAPIAHAVKSE